MLEVRMVYVKSIIAGVLALLLVAVLIPMVVLVALSVIGPGIDMPRWHLESPFFWLPAIIIFGAGFFWEYRRLSK
jgi:hypothetical protein